MEHEVLESSSSREIRLRTKKVRLKEGGIDSYLIDNPEVLLR